jgi:hypothetical protein
MTYVDVPPKAAILHSLELTTKRRQHLFCRYVRGLRDPAGQSEKAAAGKVAVHDASRNSAGFLRKGYKESRTCAQPWVRAIRSFAPMPRPTARRSFSASAQQLRDRDGDCRQRSAARCPMGSCHSAAVRHVP